MAPTRYRAFISYVHSDVRWARWLQSALERYRPPKLAGPSGSESATGRLFPIFRDRDELPSSSDLTESIRSALEASDALIVVCSPAAAKSRWVNEEIRYFQSLGRSRNIHCLLVGGSPLQASPACAFPPALLETADGTPLPEPLAADVNPRYDGKRGAMLKIAAGLLGLGFDDLRQRDAQRQLRQRSLWVAGAVAVAFVTLAFAIAAHVARGEAELRRGQAEGLISFMLGDLRSRLEPLGRLDLLDSVGDEAMDYFEVLGDRGTEQDVLARVMALRQIGEVRFRQGRFGPAQATFEESRNLAEHLVDSEPDNQEYLFEIGQAEFWVGYAALEQADLAQAESSFLRYMDYSRQLWQREPDNPDYQAELSYALSNLGTVSMERRKDETALDYFQQSATLSEALLDKNPGDIGLRVDLGNGYSWVGAAQLQLGRVRDSEAAYRKAVDVLSDLHEESGSSIHAEYLAQNEYHLGDVQAHQGELASAEEQFRMARGLLEGLVAHDPENAVWRVDRAISAYHLGELARVTDNAETAREALSAATADLTLLLGIDPADVRSACFLALTERSLGLLEQSSELVARANERARELVARTDALNPQIALVAAITGASYGRILHASGNAQAAETAWSQSLGFLDTAGNSGPADLAVRSTLLCNLGHNDEAAALQIKLAEAGFRDPRFLAGRPDEGATGDCIPGT